MTHRDIKPDSEPAPHGRKPAPGAGDLAGWRNLIRSGGLSACDGEPATAPQAVEGDPLGPVTDAEWERWSEQVTDPAGDFLALDRISLDALLAARREAWLRALPADAAKLIAEGREIEQAATATAECSPEPWTAKDLVVTDDDGLMVADCNVPDQGYSAIDHAVMIAACHPARLKRVLGGLLHLAERGAQADDERDKLRVDLARLSKELTDAHYTIAANHSMYTTQSKWHDEQRDRAVKAEHAKERAEGEVQRLSWLKDAAERAAKAEAALVLREARANFAGVYLRDAPNPGLARAILEGEHDQHEFIRDALATGAADAPASVQPVAIDHGQPSLRELPLPNGTLVEVIVTGQLARTHDDRRTQYVIFDHAAEHAGFLAVNTCALAARTDARFRVVGNVQGNDNAKGGVT